MRATETWNYIDLKINHFDAFQEVYGFVASTGFPVYGPARRRDR
jgi:hypothetical protein